MSRPITLPGVLGIVGKKYTILLTCNVLNSNPTTLGNWARNRNPMPAIASGKLAALMESLEIEPVLYQIPGEANRIAASTHEGWITWELRTPYHSYKTRERYEGNPRDLLPVTTELIVAAKNSGWPY